MKNIFWLLIGLLFIVACNKDKFKTEPQVEIKSLGPAEVSNGDLISFRADLRDSEGDFDTLLLVRKRFNASTLLNVDTIRTSFSTFNIPQKNEVELNVILAYGIIRSDLTSFFESLANVDNRFFSMGLVVKDKAGHRSSFVESEKIHLRKL